MKRDVLVAVGLIVGRRGPYTTMTTGLPTKVQSTMNPEVVLNVLEVVNRGIGTASEYRIPTVLPNTYSKILFPSFSLPLMAKTTTHPAVRFLCDS